MDIPAELLNTRVGGRNFTYWVQRGIVTNIENWSTTHVSSSGGGIYDNGYVISSTPVQVHSHTNQYARIWLREADGTESHIKVTNFEFPCLVGHEIYMVMGCPANKKTGSGLVVCNMNLGSVHWIDPGINTEATKCYRFLSRARNWWFIVMGLLIAAMAYVPGFWKPRDGYSLFFTVAIGFAVFAGIVGSIKTSRREKNIRTQLEKIIQHINNGGRTIPANNQYIENGYEEVTMIGVA